MPDLTAIELLDGEIRRMREIGYTLEDIGEKAGVSRERIRQIIKKYYPGTKPKTLTEPQVAKAFGISIGTIKGYRKRGLLHPVRFGNIYRYDEKTLAELKATLNRPCRICGNPIPPGNTRLCTKCSTMMRNSKLRLTLPGEKEKKNECMKRWKKARRSQLTVNFQKHEISLAGKKLNLTPIEFKLLGVLSKKPKQVSSRAQLIKEAIGYNYDGYDRNINVHIMHLRRKLESHPNNPIFIKTVHGVGYIIKSNA